MYNHARHQRYKYDIMGVEKRKSTRLRVIDNNYVLYKNIVYQIAIGESHATRS